MRKAYKLLIQTEEDIHNNTAGQKKVELDLKKLRENGSYSREDSDEEIIREQMHSLLDGLLDEYLFAGGEKVD